jgi:outer membrane biosynthesis protein TonB
MTPGDIRKLIGGYATGTLTEAERQMLFEAALEDQELFDELAREQALKEMLDEPDARDRLISTLKAAELKAAEPQRTVLWPWAVGAAFFAPGVVRMVILYRPPAPQQIAAVTRRSEPAAPQAAPQVVPSPPSAAPRRVAPKAAKPAAEPAPAPPSAPPPATPKPALPAAPKPAPPPAPKEETQAIGQLTAPAGSAQGASVQAAPRQAFARAAIAPAAAKPVRFAFDYTFEPGGPLQIRTTGEGYLSVIARAAGSGHVVFPSDGDGRVANGSVTSIDIPQDATEMSIFFSAQSGNAVADDSAAKTKDEATIRDSSSGTIEDPAPSPNSRLAVTVRVKK